MDAPPVRFERRLRCERCRRIGQEPYVDPPGHTLALVGRLPHDERARFTRRDADERRRAQIGQRVVGGDHLVLRIHPRHDELWIDACSVGPGEEERVARAHHVHVVADGLRHRDRLAHQTPLGVEPRERQGTRVGSRQRDAVFRRDCLPRRDVSKDAARYASWPPVGIERLRENVVAARRWLLGPHAHGSTRRRDDLHPHDLVLRARQLDGARVRLSRLVRADDAERIAEVRQRFPHEEKPSVVAREMADDERARVGRGLSDDMRLRLGCAVLVDRHRDDGPRARCSARDVRDERALVAAREVRTNRALLQRRNRRHVGLAQRIGPVEHDARAPMRYGERRPELLPSTAEDRQRHQKGGSEPRVRAPSGCRLASEPHGTSMFESAATTG